MDWNECVVDVPREFAGRPLLFTILAGEIKLLDVMAVEGCILSINQSVMSVDPNSLIIV